MIRRYAAAAAAAGIAAAVGVWPASAAQAHGAPVSPVNRATVCAVAGTGENLAVCRAALAANGRPFGNFDNLRVPGVAGNDKQFIPDGQLCSASLPEFRGLDLARADWPATTVDSGSTMAVQYRATIPHRGSFRIYLTRSGYNPLQALRWQDLRTDPIATIVDPPLRDGSYRMTAPLPAGLTGRHVLYTVWQTSDTPDTYYSCSDLLLKPAPGEAGGADPRPAAPGRPAGQAPSASPGGGTSAKPLVTVSPTGAALPAPIVEAAPPPGGTDAARESWLGPPQPILTDRIALGQQLVSAALVVLVGVTAGLALVRMRAARAAQGVHRRAEKR
jgi:predicted carbohydrate-binding protein with CBM5 and CBM33 domain